MPGALKQNAWKSRAKGDSHLVDRMAFKEASRLSDGQEFSFLTAAVGLQYAYISQMAVKNGGPQSSEDFLVAEEALLTVY